MSDFEPELGKSVIKDYGEHYADKKSNAKIKELEDKLKESDIEITYLKGQIEDLEDIVKKGSFKTADGITNPDDLSIDEIGLYNIMVNQSYVLKRLL